MPNPYYDKNGITIYCGDCLEVMPQLDTTFDCVIADPPYFKIVKEDWDRQWDKLSDYVAWIEKVVLKIKKILSTKGSFYIFGDDKVIAYVQVMIDQYLTLLNSLVWVKTGYLHQRGSAHNFRSYAPVTERILFYTPQLCPTGLETVKLDLNNFRPLREYFRGAKENAKISYKIINKSLGTASTGGGMASHYFSDIGQWSLPTKEHYQILQRLFNGFLRREYEDLRREYEDLRREYEDLRRTFNATSDTFDVITGPIVSQSENTDHPTTKPIWLISHLMQVSTNQGMVILDPFMGSGTTLVAAQREGRKAVGIELNEEYCKIAVERLRQPSFFSIVEKPKNGIIGKQLGLIENA